MSDNELLKYLTKEIVSYADLTKDQKQQYRMQRKKKKKEAQFFLSSKWFGLIPFSLQVWLRKRKRY